MTDYSQSPNHTLETPLGKVEVRANGGGKVTLDTRTGCNEHHELIVNRVSVHVWVTLESAEAVDVDGRETWWGTELDEQNKRGRGLFWGYRGFGFYWKNEGNQRADSYSRSLTDSGGMKIRELVYKTAIDWLHSEAGKSLLEEGERCGLDRKIEEARRFVRQREQDLDRRRAVLDELEAQRQMI